MKSFRQFLEETPTNILMMQTLKEDLHKHLIVDLSRDLIKRCYHKNDLLSSYQTPAETGEADRFNNIYPVLKVSLKNSQGDGPSIDQMVYASKEYVKLMDDSTIQRIRKHFSIQRRMEC